MLKYIYLVLLVLISSFAKSQVPAGLPSPNSNGYSKYGYSRADSGFILTPRDTLFTPKYAGTFVYYQNSTDSSFWVYNGKTSQRKWDKIVMISQGNINGYLLLSDTASMLVPYLRKFDTTAMLSGYIRNTKIGVTVQPYNSATTLLGNTTTGSGSTIVLNGSPTLITPSIAAINVSGGIASLPTGSGTLMYGSDTTSLSNRINNKIGISDTASMLTPYHAAYYSSSFDTSSRVLTLNPIIGTPTTVIIPRGSASGATGISVLSSSRIGNLASVSGDNGSITYFSINSTDSATRVHFSDSSTTGFTTWLLTKKKVDSLGSVIDTKLAISDTAAMMSGYRRNSVNITNADLVNSTISGVPLGTNLYSLTPSYGINGSIYNGSSAISNWKVDTTAISTKFNVTNTLLGYKLNSDSTFNTGYTTRLQTKRVIDSLGFTKVGISDSSSMLSNYVRTANFGLTKTGQALGVDTFLIATRLRVQKSIDSLGSVKVGVADTANMLLPYARSYQLANYVPLARTLTINGTGFDLSSNRTWSVGTVTSVATNNASGITGGTITSSGTIAADTSILATRLRVQKGVDSVAALIPSLAPYKLVADSGFVNGYTTRGTTKKVVDSLAALISSMGGGTVLSVATTNGFGINSSVASPSINPNITIATDTSLLATRLRVQKGIDSLGAIVSTKGVGSVTSVAASAGTGISVSGSPITSSGTITITNTAPDQTVSLTAGTGISTSGTYPNFTITNTSPSSGGTVTSIATNNGSGITGGTITGSGTIAADTTVLSTKANVTKSLIGYLSIASAASTYVTSISGTSPIVSSGGLTPAISIPAATTSVNGYLSSTDWNTFNGKQAALSGSGLVKSTTGTITYITDNSGNWDNAYTQRLQWDGGSTNLVAATGRTSLGGTTVGQNFFTLTNPSAISFPRINADNTVTALDAATFRSAIGAGTSSTTGTVTSVSMSVPTGLDISGSPITSSGTLALSLTTGYSIPTTSSQSNWNTAYNKILTTAALSTTTLTLTLNDASTVTASVPTWNQATTGQSGSVANAVTFNNGGAGAVSGTTFNGSAAQTISYNTIGAAASGATFTLGSTSIALGSTTTTVAGLSSVTSTAFVGTLSTAAQPNITSVGTLTSLNIAGNLFVSAANSTIVLDHPSTASYNALFYRTAGADKWYVGTSLASATNNYQIYNYTTSTLAFNLDITSSAITTGTWNASTIGVAYGGTGLTTLTSNYLYKGNGTSAMVQSGISDDGTTVELLRVVKSTNYFKSDAAPSNTVLSTGNNYYGYQNYWGLRTATDYSFNVDVYNSAAPFRALSISQSGNTELFGALTGTSATFSGRIYSTAAQNQQVINWTGTTGYGYIGFTNTTGFSLFGVEGSASGTLQTGDGAYSTVLTTVGTTRLSLGTNQVERLGFDGTTGAAAFTVPLTGTSATFSGTVTTNENYFQSAVSSNIVNYGLIVNRTGASFPANWRLRIPASSTSFGIYSNSLTADVLSLDYTTGAATLSSTTASTSTTTGALVVAGGVGVAGSIYANAIYQTSDERLKNIISRNGDMITFTWKDKRDSLVHYGYSAQQIDKQYPMQVSKGETWGVNYTEIHTSKIQKLENEVAELKLLVNQLLHK